jgi:hypothetical protein
MAVSRFAHQFFDAVAIHVNRGMRAAREGSFAGQVKIGVFWGSQVYSNRRISVNEQTAPAKVRAGSNLCMSWEYKQAKRS